MPNHKSNCKKEMCTVSLIIRTLQFYTCAEGPPQLLQLSVCIARLWKAEVLVELVWFFCLDISMTLFLLIPWLPAFLFILLSRGEAQEQAQFERETSGCVEMGKTHFFETQDKRC